MSKASQDEVHSWPISGYTTHGPLTGQRGCGLKADERFPWETEQANQAKGCFLDYEFQSLVRLVEDAGFKASNSALIFEGLQRHGFQSFNQFDTTRVSPKLLAHLSQPKMPPISPFAHISKHPSSDGSIKYIYTLRDGFKVESVWMPFGKYATLCISSQAGCALGCTFCATGARGFKRHLTPGEMIGQVIHMRRDNPFPNKQPGRVNVVFMGMGEPLHNFSGVLAVFRSLTHPNGMVLSDNDVAVSTSGLLPKIEELGKLERRPRLMVSIAATTDEARSAIMPVNRAYNLETLLTSLESFPLKKKERIMLSYVLIAGINDSEDDARRLAAMSRRFPSLVNLIPMNAHQDSPGMDEPTEDHLTQFSRLLKDLGAFTTIRRSRGRDVAGACGQLASQT